MIYNIFINILAFTFFVFLGSQLILEIPLRRHSKITVKILYGVLGSFMNLTFTILKVNDPIIFINSSFLSVILIYYYGGFISGIITAICSILYLIMHLGEIDFVLFISILFLTSLILFHFIDKLIKNRWKKWLSYLIVSILVIICIDIYDHEPILLSNLLTSVLTGTYLFYLIKYLNSTQTLFIKYKTEAHYDYLTGLSNSRAFDIQFNKIVEENKLTNMSISVFMIDIDFFKMVNDTFGHEVGDNILKEVGLILKSKCRINDVVSRVGGEEFCIVIVNCDKPKAIMMGEEIREAVGKCNFYNKNNEVIHITVSIGISVYPDTTYNVSELKNNADDALYLAKHNGRNKVCII